MFKPNLPFRERGNRVAGAMLVALALATGACTARVDTVHPVAADEVYVDSAPYVATAPTAVYQGQTDYYVNGHWYRPHGRGWAYYRNAPPELTRQRPYVQAAPPAYRGYGGGPRPGYPGGTYQQGDRPVRPGRAPDAVRVQ